MRVLCSADLEHDAARAVWEMPGVLKSAGVNDINWTKVEAPYAALFTRSEAFTYAVEIDKSFTVVSRRSAKPPHNPLPACLLLAPFEDFAGKRVLQSAIY